jgi:hypothetical protein
MRFAYFLFLLPFIYVKVIGQSNTPDASTWITNGTVNSVVYSNEKVYLGGDFTHVGPMVPFGTVLNSSTGLPNMSYAAPNGAVRAVLPDGSGGWYIGGDFTSVGGVTRNRLARINSDGTLHDWNPNVNNSVYTLALSGSTLYIGGSFTSVGGVTRSRIARINSDGTVHDWNPGVATGIVFTIALDGNTLYIGGSFTTVAGTTRNRIAALNATADGTAELPYLTSWNPNASGIVYTIAISGSTVYVGGNFSGANSINGNIARNRLAALDGTTGVATNWNPNANNLVNALVISGSTVYVGGLFTTIGGQSRARIAALVASTGSATSWNPNADFDVNSLLISGTTLYVGGNFATIAGQSRARIAALNTSDGSATDWNPKAGAIVRALAVNGASVYIGGEFNSIGGEVRNRLARLDAATGQADSWNPNADNTVRAMLISAGKLYVGGDFTTIGVVTRNRIAAFDEVDGTLTSFDPNVINGEVSSLAVNGSTVYLGGTYNGANSINGNTSRNRLAAVDGTTGVATNWDPNVNGKVNAIAVHDGKVYFGGQFLGANAINGTTTRNRLAAVNVSDGIVTSWDPNTNGEVFAVAVNNGLIYVAGNCLTFTSSGQTITRNRLAALNSTTGVPTDWNPNPANTVSTMAFSGAMVYVGRGFNSIGGSSRQNAAGVFLNLNTSNATSWSPTPGSFVFSIAVGGNKVFVGGNFPTVGSENRRGFASYSISSVEWGGSSGGNWNDTSNWAPGIVPNTGASISIPAGMTNYPVPPSTVTMSSLTVSSGVSFALGSSVLTITGNLTNNGTISGSGKVVMAGTSAQTISGAGTVHNIEINNTSGGVAITSGSNKLNVTGLYTPTSGVLTTNGNLVFRSTATQEGIVGTAGTCPTEPISGDVTVEKYIPAKRAFRFLTPGVTTTTTINANWQEGRSINSTAGYPYAGGTTENPTSGYGTHIMGTGGSTNGFDLSISNNPSLFTFNASSYAWVAEANTNDGGNILQRGEAYRLFVRGDRGANLNTDTEDATATTIRTTGVLKVCESMSFNTTSPLVPLSSVAGRYSFIGNPYWSVVDWHLVDKSGVEDNLYYWDPTMNGTNLRGAYVTYNQANQSNNTPPGTGIGTSSSLSRYIQPGQAFFVRNLATVNGSNLPSITFEHADIVGSSPTRTTIFGKNNLSAGGELGMDDQQRVRGNAPIAIEKIYVSLLIKNKIAAGPADGFLVAYNQGFTDTYGREDASKFANLDENIAAVYNGSRQSILGLQSASGSQIKSDTIPISMTNLYDGEYLLKVSIDKSVSPVREVYVVNRVTKQQYKVDYTKGLELSFLNSITKTKDDLALVVNSQSIPNPVRTRSQLVIFPNPVTTGSVEVIVPNISGKNDMMNKPAYVEILSSNNQILFTQNVTLDATGKAMLDVSSLTSGGYVVRVYVDRNSFTTKLIKP